MAQTEKHLPAMQETQVQFLGREDPLEKEMAIHSSTLAWKIPWTEEPDRWEPRLDDPQVQNLHLCTVRTLHENILNCRFIDFIRFRKNLYSLFLQLFLDPP